MIKKNRFVVNVLLSYDVHETVELYWFEINVNVCVRIDTMW